MQHHKFPEVLTLVKNDINVLITGPAGTGKTTLLRNICETLELNFHSIPMTKQTTLNALLGFISLNGEYIPSQLRKAVEHGGMMLLDELDAADPNTVLCLNTLENGYLAFPDGVVTTHKDFRLVATANPQDQHNVYTGRSKLDAATLDRFDIITLERDPKLELELTDADTAEEVNAARGVLIDNSASREISMRDTIRYHKRKKIGLGEKYVHTLLGGEVSYIEDYQEKIAPAPVENSTDYSFNGTPKAQTDCVSINELWGVIEQEGKLQAAEAEIPF